MSVERQHLGNVEVLRQSGSGTPYVMLHGIGSAADSFLPLMAMLADADCIAWNMPGYGASPPLLAGWPSPDDYAAALLAMLKAGGIARCHLVGHSLGNVNACRFALLYPDFVAHYTALSPALGYGTAPGAALPAGVQARLDDFSTLGAPAMALARASRLVYRPEDRPHVLKAVCDAMSRVSAPGYVQASRLLACADVLADAAAVRVPSSVAIGADDVITKPANGERLATALRTGRLHIVANAGHALPQEQPATIARLLRDIAI